jgi:hypothetical protein
LRFKLKTLFWLTAAVAAFFGGWELGDREECNDHADPVLVERTRRRDESIEDLQAESKRSEECCERRAERARRREAAWGELWRRLE